MSQLVVALVGTDHHPFERMVDWIDAAARRRPDVRFVVQHGATRPPSVAEGRDFLAHDDLLDLLSLADAVVCHGGPGTIVDAREVGHLPLCVPRDPALGEHVDGHPQPFAALVARSGVVHHITDEDGLHAELERTLAGAGSATASSHATATRDAARTRLAAELNTLMAAGTRRRSRFRRAS